MTPFYISLVGAPDDLSPVTDAYNHYTKVYVQITASTDELTRHGQRLEEAARLLPGIVGNSFAVLQEIEQIIKFLENREKRLLGTKRRLYREHYNRDLTDSMVEKYAESDVELLELAEVRNMFALIRNKFLGLSKRHEMLHYGLGNISRLRAAGVEGTVL